jgi:hypothetical protein
MKADWLNTGGFENARLKVGHSLLRRKDRETLRVGRGCYTLRILIVPAFLLHQVSIILYLHNKMSVYVNNPLKEPEFP